MNSPAGRTPPYSTEMSGRKIRVWPWAPAVGSFFGALLLAYSSDVDVLQTGFSRAMADLKGK